MRVVIYEENHEDFYPLINLYPQFNLRIGMKTIAENIQHYFPNSKIEYIARGVFKYKESKVVKPTVYLSGRFIMTKKFTIANEEKKFSSNSSVVGFIKSQPPYPRNNSDIQKTLKKIHKSQNVSGFVINNAWDLIKYNEAMLFHHFKINKEKSRTFKNINIIGNKKNLFVAKNALIHNQVSIDLTDGPVYIDKAAIVRPFSTITGPSYIGKGTIIDHAKVVKSSIGPQCRIGGEIEGSIFQGYANKHHGGFIGHSFIGEWVNLGALTTNSDLKNNYGPVRIKIRNKSWDTGMIKLGCFIGDHTKTGIGTLIPTGAVIGSFVNFFGGGMMPSYVPCFKWLSTKKVENYDFKKAIATAKIVMKRRNIKMTKQYEDLIRTYYKNLK